MNTILTSTQRALVFMQHDAHFYKLQFLFHNAKLMSQEIVVESRLSRPN